MKNKFLLAALTAMASLMAFTACNDSETQNPASPIADNPQQTDQPIIIPADTTTPATNPPEITDPIGNPETGDTSVILPPIPNDSALNTTDTTTPPVPVTNGCADGEIPTPVEFPLNEFVDIGDVYKAIQCNEKVIFMIRHGERSRNFSGKESPLTEDGIEEAIAMGQKLIGPESFYFIHTGFVRTYQTALYAAVGRGQAQVLEDGTAIGFTADTITQLTDGWYLKDKAKRDSIQDSDSTLKNVNVMYAAWAYEGLYSEVFYDLEERSEELLNTYVIKDYAVLPKSTLIASHDQLLMPLLVYTTQKQIDLKLHNVTAPRNWLTFLAGVAVIVNDKNEIRFVPVKGGATGVE